MRGKQSRFLRDEVVWRVGPALLVILPQNRHARRINLFYLQNLYRLAKRFYRLGVVSRLVQAFSFGASLGYLIPLRIR